MPRLCPQAGRARDELNRCFRRSKPDLSSQNHLCLPNAVYGRMSPSRPSVIEARIQPRRGKRSCSRAELTAAGHDVIWTGDLPEDPGDAEILARAHAERRILVTLDKDFGELAIVRGTPHSGILRLVNMAARQQAAVCLHVIGQHAAELQAGAIITAEPGRLRLRPPDPPNGTP